MLDFSDMLYGRISVPSWIEPFLRIPEFVRLRGVRLSNVDSFQFKDFSGASRWEHCVAVAGLAMRCATGRGLSERDAAHLILAALLHDVATPPFAHTMEYVLDGFNHELESYRVLSSSATRDPNSSIPVFASQLAQFHKVCEKVSKHLGFQIDPDEVGSLVVGGGECGFLLNGTIDLDNADNVVRAAMLLGISVDRRIPLGIADWLAVQKSPPLNLESIQEPIVSQWRSVRNELYSAFYSSSPEELGRQAFLQHLCRRADRSDIPRSKLIWNTDDGLLTLLEGWPASSNSTRQEGLSSLVRRYRLLEPVLQIAEIEILDDETLRILRSPVVTSWIEEELCGDAFEPFVLVSSRRFQKDTIEKTLFPPAPGTISIFKLGGATKANQLPGWLNCNTPGNLGPGFLKKLLSRRLRQEIQMWLLEKPWLRTTVRRKKNVRHSLDAVGDWSFRLSRNETLHSYPSTFVHAIPACLLSALGLQGELILDPFGGTGQTAVETIKVGGRAVSADINSVATLVARSRLTYLPASERAQLRGISTEDLYDCDTVELPVFPLIDRWHHRDTILELRRIRRFIEKETRLRKRQFMEAAFSAILTSTTGRKGRQHGFFADNTPLSRGMDAPPYENAVQLFLARLKKSLSVIEGFYSSIERSERDPEQELQRAHALHVDVISATPKDYGIIDHTAAAVITSPPYLCMSDYSLGQRLSYYWLFPKRLAPEHQSEIGARRKRFNARQALNDYLKSYERFASLSAKMLRPGGFLVTILGAPLATAFAGANVLDSMDSILSENGFSLLWDKWRDIQWHRNHGYARLKTERIAVYVAK